MNWIEDLFLGESVAHSVIVLALSIALGILFGRIKIFGVALGATCILFMGILFGELGMGVDPTVLAFFQDFGLILFVFAIGLQVGPSFFGNLKQDGRVLNFLALAGVMLSVGVTIALYYLTDTPLPTMVGIMSGAVTNIPGLGAANQAYTDITGTTDPSIAMGCAVAYPLAILGFILSVVLIRVIGRIDVKREEELILKANKKEQVSAVPVSLEITNPALFGGTVATLSQLLVGKHFVVSRIWKKSLDEVQIVTSNTILDEGDKIFVITEPDCVEPLKHTVGPELHIDRKRWTPENSKYVARKIVVTNKSINGKTLGSLNLRALYGVNVTRIYRANVDILAVPNFTLQYGDRLTVVGSDAAIESIIPILGNSVKQLKEPNLITIFIGIVLGILVGAIPFAFPGVPQPIKLGTAGGPLVVAILIARWGHKLKLVPYTTTSANLILREMGISIFLACVGLNAGNGFVDTVVNQGGWVWVGYGLLITMIPLLIVGLFGRFVLKINYLQLCGLLSGGTTNPPALAYTNSLSESDPASVSYVMVYPLTMFMRVLVAQLMIIFLL